MESDEARKALALALKHDQGGNTEGALKWARKSIAIHTTVEAERLLARLEKSGASGAGAGAGASPFGSGSASASASASASTSGGADGLRNRSSASTNGTAKPPNGVPKPAAAARAAETPKREFTAEQEAVVKKVKRSGGDFYAVLGLEKSCEEAAIKKAYRKLALQLHPDKNGAPGADEAFKLVSKAFTILSDKDKRGAYDRYGGDPDNRYSSAGAAAGGGMGGMRAGGPAFRRAGGGMYADEIDPQDLFNMFFGGGMGSGFTGGTTFHFGGPGVRQQTFQRRPTQARRGEAGQAQNASIFLQLMPLLILALFSFLSYAPSLFSTPDPSFTFAPSGMHRTQRFTPRNGVSYYVSGSQFEQHPTVGQGSAVGLPAFENKVENAYKNHLYGNCERVREHQARRLQAAGGLFGIGRDREAEQKIRNERYESCERLLDFGIRM